MNNVPSDVIERLCIRTTIELVAWGWESYVPKATGLRIDGASIACPSARCFAVKLSLLDLGRETDGASAGMGAAETKSSSKNVKILKSSGQCSINFLMICGSRTATL